MKTNIDKFAGFDPEENELLVMDGYDDCIVGVVERFGQPPIVCYDKEKVLSKLERGTTCPLCEGSGDLDGFGGGGKTKCHGCDGTGGRMSSDEAKEFFYFNQIGAWMGEATPCFLSSND